MAIRGGRLTCPRCGANNFDTVTSCWKCGAPVGAAPQTAAPGQGSLGALSSGREASYAPGALGGDPEAARRAAIWLALVFPLIGLPVGWIFMMIEDGRRQAVGRVCVLWSTAALVVHMLLGCAMSFAAVPAALSILRAVQPMSAGGNSGIGRTNINNPLGGEGQ